VSPESPKRKRKLSGAGRRAIRAATKKRWAAFHAAKKGTAKKTAAKKVAVKAPVIVAVKKTALKKASKEGREGS
jgi:hypothetical protein